MLRGLWRLTWLEIKIFVREPLGLVGSVAVPVVAYGVVGRLLGGGSGAPEAATFAKNGSLLCSAITLFQALSWSLSSLSGVFITFTPRFLIASRSFE